VIGGVLFDRWGFSAPFVTSAALALAAFIFAAVMLPETRPRTAARVARVAGSAGRIGRRVSAALTAPVRILAALLVLDFTAVFSYAFIEPQMYFYLYGHLGFTAAEVGSLIGALGLALVAAQAGLGQLSDRIGRRVPVVAGFGLLGLFYLALAGVHARAFALLLFVAAVGGLGDGLLGPALSASYLDITREQNRSVVAGIMGSASSLGGVAGPFLVAVLSPVLGARGVFAGSAALAALAAVLALWRPCDSPGVPPSRRTS
jgi:MFS family permease